MIDRILNKELYTSFWAVVLKTAHFLPGIVQQTIERELVWG